MHDEKASVKATVTNPPNGKQDSLATVNSAVIEAMVQTSEAEVASLRAQLREANTMNQDLKLQLQKQIDYSAMEKGNSIASNSEKLSLQHNSVPSSIDIGKVSLEVDSLRQENNMLKENCNHIRQLITLQKNQLLPKMNLMPSQTTFQTLAKLILLPVKCRQSLSRYAKRIVC